MANNSFLIERHRRGPAVHPVQLRYLPRSIGNKREGKAVLLKNLLGAPGILLIVDGQDDQTLARESFMQLLKMAQFSQAWRRPRFPEVQDYRVSA
jgi:hypothetical protein